MRPWRGRRPSHSRPKPVRLRLRRSQSQNLRLARRRPSPRMRSSMMPWHPMGHGSMSAATACAGSPRSRSSILVGGRIVIVVTGIIPIAGGTGCRIIPGVGRRSTLDDGFATPAGVGAGRRTASGVLPGFAGGIQMTIAAGRLCRRPLASGPASASFTAAIRSVSVLISESRQAATRLFPRKTSVTTGSRASVCRTTGWRGFTIKR